MKHSWKCPYCKKLFVKDTPSGLGLSKENHLRSHGTNLEKFREKYPDMA